MLLLSTFYLIKVAGQADLVSYWGPPLRAKGSIPSGGKYFFELQIIVPDVVQQCKIYVCKTPSKITILKRTLFSISSTPKLNTK